MTAKRCKRASVKPTGIAPHRPPDPAYVSQLFFAAKQGLRINPNPSIPIRCPIAGPPRPSLSGRQSRLPPSAADLALIQKLGLVPSPVPAPDPVQIALLAVKQALWPSQLQQSVSSAALNPGPMVPKPMAGQQAPAAQPLMPPDQPSAQPPDQPPAQTPPKASSPHPCSGYNIRHQIRHAGNRWSCGHSSKQLKCLRGVWRVCAPKRGKV
jgi:hypothetical protein